MGNTKKKWTREEYHNLAPGLGLWPERTEDSDRCNWLLMAVDEPPERDLPCQSLSIVKASHFLSNIQCMKSVKEKDIFTHE